MLRPILLLIALAAGGGAAWIATQHTTPEPVVMAAAPAPVTEMTAVLVAAQDVPRGSEVTADALRWQEWPVDAVPITAIERDARPRAPRDLVGKYASRPILAGEPITDAALAAEPGGFLAAVLAPGMRAVAIQANTQSTAGGFILPNDRVDVLHTSARFPGATEVRSRTILKGVRVLAIDQTTDGSGSGVLLGNSGTVLGKTATLELTEQQVEAVTAAEATGTLSLSLRPRHEAPGEVTTETAAPSRTIRINRGTSIEDIIFN